jgi:hypothetical protein
MRVDRLDSYQARTHYLHIHLRPYGFHDARYSKSGRWPTSKALLKAHSMYTRSKRYKSRSFWILQIRTVERSGRPSARTRPLFRDTTLTTTARICTEVDYVSLAGHSTRTKVQLLRLNRRRNVEGKDIHWQTDSGTCIWNLPPEPPSVYRDWQEWTKVRGG